MNLIQSIHFILFDNKRFMSSFNFQERPALVIGLGRTIKIKKQKTKHNNLTNQPTNQTKQNKQGLLKKKKKKKTASCGRAYSAWGVQSY